MGYNYLVPHFEEASSFPGQSGSGWRLFLGSIFIDNLYFKFYKMLKFYGRSHDTAQISNHV